MVEAGNGAITMRKILLYGHGGAYNHGAEAIIRTTVPILRKSGDCEILLSTHFPEQDRQFGLDKLVDQSIPADLSLVPEEKAASSFSVKEDVARKIYREALSAIDSDTVCLAVGGDNYCYPNWHRQAIFHNQAIESGAKSVLWSCSIEPGCLDDRMMEVLRTHHLITVRDAITYEALASRGLTNLVKVSDVAFTLEPESTDFDLENYVAVNISPLVMRKNPAVLQEYQRLMDYILRETGLNVALVPHVIQPVDNDYDAFALLKLQDSSRVAFVSDKLSAAQYKSIISKARLCVSARTHAAIAAYSSCVPTLAVGYSVKAGGIAKDIFGTVENYVISVESLRGRGELVQAFVWLLQNENLIREQYRRILPIYSRNSYARIGQLCSDVCTKR